MVMEYCKFDLAHLIGFKHEALDTQYIKYIVGSIVQGIQACHEMGVVHCDIKSKVTMKYFRRLFCTRLLKQCKLI
ncbi:hypothetical protein BC937DRAFT_93897 [Endogone sp. FLAS-F59071]|nr:hypothetical protein BC937DRAFT_93897 [Endogone sp. FLAS-F59071]|eukprot:RUS20991.1 hypothetical protein BC937DRAFT_93897 [Endogone sp. FLAS-F59071]